MAVSSVMCLPLRSKLSSRPFLYIYTKGRLPKEKQKEKKIPHPAPLPPKIKRDPENNPNQRWGCIDTPLWIIMSRPLHDLQDSFSSVIPYYRSPLPLFNEIDTP